MHAGALEEWSTDVTSEAVSVVLSQAVHAGCTCRAASQKVIMVNTGERDMKTSRDDGEDPSARTHTLSAHVSVHATHPRVQTRAVTVLADSRLVNKLYKLC